MARKMKIDLGILIALAPLLGKSADEIGDLLAPKGFNKKDTLDALDAALDVAQVLDPTFRTLPRLAVHQAVGGLFDATAGLQELVEWFKRKAGARRAFGDLDRLEMEPQA